MKKGKGLSMVILMLCIGLVFQYDTVVAGISKWISDDYVKVQTFIFNQNDDFEHRGEVITLKDGYVIVDPDEVKYIDASGKAMWRKDLSSQNFRVAGGRHLIVLADRKAGDIFVLNDRGEITATLMGLGIIDRVKIFEDAYIGALKETGEILLFDKNLKEISSMQLPKGNVLDFSINTQRQDIAAMVLDLSRNTFNSKFFLAAMNGNINSGSNLNYEIAYHMDLKSESIRILADEALHIYDYKGTSLAKIPFDRPIHHFMEQAETGEIWINLVGQTQDLRDPKTASEVLVFDVNGQEVGRFVPPMDPVDGIVAFGDHAMFYNDYDIMVVDRTGESIETYRGLETIKNIHTLENRGFAIEYFNKLEVYVRK